MERLGTGYYRPQLALKQAYRIVTAGSHMNALRKLGSDISHPYKALDSYLRNRLAVTVLNVETIWRK